MNAILIASIALGHVFAPTTQGSKPPRAPDVASSRDKLREVNEAIDAGDVQRNVEEYSEAIEQYARALSLLSSVQDPDEREQLEPSIVAGLVEAHIGAYGKTNDSRHLSEAGAAIERFTVGYRDMSPEVAAKFTEYRAKVDALRADAATRRPTRRTSDTGPVPKPTFDEKGHQKKRRLVIAGAVVTGAAGGLTIGFVTALAVNVRTSSLVRDEKNDGRLSKAEADAISKPALHAAIATSVLMGAAIPAGVVLLVVGKRRPPSDRWVYAPTFSRHGAGLSLSRRF
jgi:hypothetical protein